MSFARLSLLSSELLKDRSTFVQKAFNEMNNNAEVNTSDKESRKTYFLQIVEENQELSEIEKQYCKERYIYFFELNDARYKRGKPRECKECNSLRYSNKYCER